MSDLTYETYSACYKRLDHEDNLIAARVSWLLAGEAFLMVPYAILDNPLYRKGKGHGLFGHTGSHLFDLIPWLGILLAVATLVSIMAAILRMTHVRKELWKAPSPVPELKHSENVFWMGFTSTWSAPILCGSVWVGVLTVWWMFFVTFIPVLIGSLLFTAAIDPRHA